MSWKRWLALEVLLLVVAAAYVVSSVVNHINQEPRWIMFLAAGFAAVYAFARPKISAIVLMSITLITVSGGLGVHPLADGLIGLWDALYAELYEWESIYFYPGPLTTTVLSLGAVFALVYFQLIIIARGFSSGALIVIGFIAYLWLWLQHYSGVERELITFLAMALTSYALFSLFNRNRQGAPSFPTRAGIMILGGITGILVTLAPYHAPLYYGQEAYAFIYNQVPELHNLQSKVEEGIPLSGRWAELPGAASMVGYSPGGNLGGSVLQSRVPVMELKIKEGTPPRSLYLRGRASNYYTGHSWETELPGTKNTGTVFEYVAAYNNQIKLEVSYLRAEKDLFGLFPTTSIRFLEEENTPRGIHIDAAGNIMFSGDAFQGTYRITGKTIAPIDLGEKTPRPQLKKDPRHLLSYLQLPEELPERVVELSNDITEGAATEPETAEKIKEYLRQFPYRTSTPAHRQDEDFVDHFLFELQEGYCAYFASAMTVLLRAQDIPARYVEGYRVTVDNEHYQEENPESTKTEIIEVKQKNAHAWVEAFLQGYGWVAFEPTPPYDLSEESAAAGDRFETEEESEETSREETEGHEEEGEVKEESGAVTEDKDGLEAGEEESEPEIAEDTTGKDPGDSPGEDVETGSENGEDDREKAPGEAGKDISWPNLPPLVWAFFVPGIFLFGAWAAVYGSLSRGQEATDVYEKIVWLKSSFHRSPSPGETPRQIVDQLKKQLPELANELEIMKNYYHLSCYAGRNNLPHALPEELQALPLKAVRLYRKNMGLFKFARVLPGLFFQKIRGYLQ